MQTSDVTRKSSLGMNLAQAGFAIALAAAVAALLSGLGHRWGWWGYQTGFLILRCAAWSGVAAAALSLFAIIVAVRSGVRRGIVYGVHGVIIGALVFGVPSYEVSAGLKLPAIHDITTDTADPPRFVAVLPLRKDAANSAEYGGAKLAALQQQGYPDLAPAMLNMPPRAAFDLALNVARASGWQIVAAAPEDNRIEATATTLMFGFKDDVVIRITPAGSGSRIDVRSVSRVGRSDLGANAARIRKFVQQLSSQSR
ncbi:MAG TPA: DUF1499 domain-containing protein [Burkholderiales bacterium]|nr:DUF1499 domain-containing protein [Burkholderiales bacterium]